MEVAMTSEAFLAEANAVCRVKPTSWCLREVTHPLESHTTPYLYALTEIAAAGEDCAPGKLLSPATLLSPVAWDSEDDDDVIPRPAIQNATLLVEVFVVLSRTYRLPVVFISARRSAPRDDGSYHVSISDLARAMPGVADYSSGEDESVRLPTAEGVSCRNGSPKLIVSEGYSEELGQALFSVHPCDMATLLALSVECLGHVREISSLPNTLLVEGHESVLLQCSLLFRLLRMIGPLLALDSRLF